MSKNKKILRNIVLLIIIIFILFPRFGLYLSPLSAHRASEKSIHYGPSEIVHIEDFDRGKYILGKYDKWISCNTVNRSLLFFWTFGDQVTGIENDLTKAVSYTWGMSEDQYKIYGIINDNRIDKIQITNNKDEVFNQTEFYDDMFLFTARDKDNNASAHRWFKSIKAYDRDDNIIFQDENPAY